MYNRKKYVQFINRKLLRFNCTIKFRHCGRRGSLPVLSTVFVTVRSFTLHASFSVFCAAVDASSSWRNASFKQTLFKLTALFEKIAVPRLGFFMSTLLARFVNDGGFESASLFSTCVRDDIKSHALPRITILFNMRRATSIK